MRGATHVLTFIRRLKTFSQQEGFVSSLKLGNGITAQDENEIYLVAGSIIAEIDNGVSELTGKLIEYYEKTGDQKALSELQSLTEQK